MKTWTLAFLLVAVGLAGCSDDGPDGSGEPIQSGADPAPTSLGAPEWRLRDYWTYDSPVGRYTLVVTEDAGSDWIVDTDHADLSFFSEVFGEISYLGRISKADLDGDQDGTRVRFLDFPLEDEKTWTATWDAEPFQMVAEDLGGEKFHVRAMQDDVVVNEFVYNNASRWFDWIQWASNAEPFRVDLVDSGRDWSGEVVRVHPELIIDEAGTGATPFVGTVDWSPEDADAYLLWGNTCTQGAVVVAVGPVESVPTIATGSDSDGFSETLQCPDASAFAGTIATAPEEGTWGAAVVPLSPDAEWTLKLYLREFERIQV